MINKLTLPWPVLFLEFLCEKLPLRVRELFVLHYQQMPIFIPVGQSPALSPTTRKPMAKLYMA